MVEHNQTERKFELKWYCLDPPKNDLDNNKTKNPGAPGLSLNEFEFEDQNKARERSSRFAI